MAGGIESAALPEIALGAHADVLDVVLKVVHPPLVSGASKAAGKGSALMLARTPAGYALKAAGAINQAQV